MGDTEDRGIADGLSCLELLRILQSYVDGRLDEETAERARTHLEACRRCGIEFSVYVQIKAALRSMSPEVPSELLERLEEFAYSLPLRVEG